MACSCQRCTNVGAALLNKRRTKVQGIPSDSTRMCVNNCGSLALEMWRSHNPIWDRWSYRVLHSHVPRHSLAMHCCSGRCARPWLKAQQELVQACSAQWSLPRYQVTTSDEGASGHPRSTIRCLSAAHSGLPGAQRGPLAFEDAVPTPSTNLSFSIATWQHSLDMKKAIMPRVWLGGRCMSWMHAIAIVRIQHPKHSLAA